MKSVGLHLMSYEFRVSCEVSIACEMNGDVSKPALPLGVMLSGWSENILAILLIRLSIASLAMFLVGDRLQYTVLSSYSYRHGPLICENFIKQASTSVSRFLIQTSFTAPAIHFNVPKV
jgi:hypothetical protein